MNKRFAMLRLPCSALRILKRLQHSCKYLKSFFANLIFNLIFQTKQPQ
ncbi:MAG: hypothetical protein LBH59_03130 [Planctomycetaceae bacterium]|nr:hypothetical protein [Planctomycetaceae bacterium]